MSSATSIKQTTRAGDVHVAARQASTRTPDDAGFRPWHFFVLASLMAATAAVMLSGRATPEHLVLLSLTIAAAGLASAALYRTLAPLATDDVSMFSESLSDRTKATLEREKMLALRSIKELEFDRAMGKVSQRDFDEMAGRLRARAISLMKELDEGQASYRVLIERELNMRLRERGGSPALASNVVAVPGCPSCGTVSDADAAFCKRCGTRLTSVGS